MALSNGAIVGIVVGVVVVGVVAYSMSQASTPSLPPPSSGGGGDLSLGAQFGDLIGRAAPGVARAFQGSGSSTGGKAPGFDDNYRENMDTTYTDAGSKAAAMAANARQS